MSKSGRLKMFFGYYEHNLDAKGRLIIPSKLREQVGDKVYILKGFDGALAIYKEEKFLEIIEEQKRLPFNKASSRDYLRAMLASVCELELDKIGRVQIPTVLLGKHGIGKELVIIGVGDHIEVWDKVKYLEYEERVDREFESNAENLGKDD